MPPILATRSRQNFSCSGSPVNISSALMLCVPAGGGFNGIGCVGHVSSPGNVALRHRPLFHRVHGLAGFAIQEKHLAGLRDRYHDRRSSFRSARRSSASARPRHRNPRHRDALAGNTISASRYWHRARRWTKSEGSGRAPCAAVIARGLADRQEYEAALLVHGADAPVCGRARGLPVVLGQVS